MSVITSKIEYFDGFQKKFTDSNREKGTLSKIWIDRAFFENRTIDLRPEAAQLRTEFSHLKANTVVSKRGISTCLATFIERKNDNT